jgi:hypothetical protein
MYRLPRGKILLLTLSGLLGQRRSFRQDARSILARLDPPPHLAGEAFIPQDGPCLLTFNHNTRPAFGVWWAAMAISAALPCEAHWLMTGAWTFQGWLGKRLLEPLSVWAFRRIGHVYDFTIMPPMPPRPGEVQGRALAVRRLVTYTRSTQRPLLVMAPEGMDTQDGRLGWPPPGVGRLIDHLHQMGLAITPAGVWEEAGCFQVRFGPAYALEIGAGLSAETLDRQVSRQVMRAIARLLPERLGGEF